MDQPLAAPSGPSRGRKRDADATRAALLEAARELFGRHGYEAVTLRVLTQDGVKELT
ncbi:MAG: TetR family transcriptional regulator, partial [Streptomyces albidoflavus]